MTPNQAKSQICEIGRRIWQRGYCSGNEGNHSVRIGKKVFCTPSQISKGFMNPTDIAMCDLKGKQLAGKRKRTSEIFLHLAIYNARPDVGAVVHGHPPHATAFAISGISLPTCIHPEAEVFLGKVPTVPYVCPGDNRLGDSILPYIQQNDILLLGSHGVVTAGKDLTDAYYKFEVLEAYARVLLLAQQIGSLERFSPDQMQGLLKLKERFGMTDPRLATNDYSDDSAFLTLVKAKTIG